MGSIGGMKVSVSLGEQDVEFLDAYATEHGVPSRSAAVAQAVALLRAEVLADAYAEATDEWSADPDSELWEAVVADGVDQR